MSDFTLKQHDTYPPLVAVLSDANGVIDLTSATSVTLNLKAGSGSTLGGVCTIVAPAANGQVSYTWQTADTAAINTFQAEFQINWAGGVAISTVPNDSYFVVTVIADLG